MRLIANLLCLALSILSSCRSILTRMVVPTITPRSVDEVRKLRKQAVAKSLDQCNWLCLVKDPTNATLHRNKHNEQVKAIDKWAKEWELKLSMVVGKKPMKLFC